MVDTADALPVGSAKAGSNPVCMGLVEVREPHDRAYFTACLVDIDETGKKPLVQRCGGGTWHAAGETSALLQASTT